jgi:hypothetical protein
MMVWRIGLLLLGRSTRSRLVLWQRLLRSTGREAALGRTNVLRAAAIQLFVEALGIEGVRGRGDGRQSGESDERGKDRLHGETPMCCFPKSVGERHARAGIDWVLEASRTTACGSPSVRRANAKGSTRPSWEARDSFRLRLAKLNA